MKSRSCPLSGGALRSALWGSALLLLPCLIAVVLTPSAPAWVIMTAIATTLFFALKALTLTGHWHSATGWRGVVYLLAWPGLNAPAFLRPTDVRLRVDRAELAGAMAKLAMGLSLVFWATKNAGVADDLTVGWAGMIGIIFTLHCGVMHVMSVVWRSAGLNAPPIMRAPILAVSLTEFWSERWNIAFAEIARRFLFRPMARRHGTAIAGGSVFLVSGVVHELVISLPARGGWGGPTLYFALQAAGIAAERTRCGDHAGLGRGICGWMWVFIFTVLPLPILFHAPFVGRVIVPLFNDLSVCFL